MYRSEREQGDLLLEKIQIGRLGGTEKEIFGVLATDVSYDAGDDLLSGVEETYTTRRIGEQSIF